MKTAKKTIVYPNPDGTVTLKHKSGTTLTGHPVELLDAWSGKIMSEYRRQLRLKMQEIKDKVNASFDMFRMLPTPPSIDDAAPVIAAQLGIDKALVLSILKPDDDDDDDTDDDDDE